MEHNDQSSRDAEHRLVVMSNTDLRAFPLVGSRWYVGRGTDCDLRLDDPAVSRRHMMLERLGDEFRFSDLGSRNPVVHDGRVAKSGTLRLGQTLLVGTTRLTLDVRQPVAPTIGGPATVLVERQRRADQERGGRISPSDLDPMELASVIDSLEWAVALLTAPEDLAAPMLQVALTLTGRNRGALGVFTADGFRTLASGDRRDPRRSIRVPDGLLRDARSRREPEVVSVRNRGEVTEHLLVPFGPRPDGLLVLTQDRPDQSFGPGMVQLARSLGRLIWRRMQQAEQQGELAARAAGGAGRLIGEHVLASGRLLPLRAALRAGAHRTEPLLLVGEQGTETESLARFVHAAGRRCEQPFETLSARELDPERAGLALFGGGGLLGAVDHARNGTLFVEDPERLPPPLQRDLARAVRTGRLHSGEGGRAFEPRLIGATTVWPGDGSQPAAGWDPELAAVFADRVHEVPPLRADARDIESLAELMLGRLGSAPNGAPRTLGERALRVLTDYPWPGNVAELQDVLRQAAERAASEPIAPRHLPEHLAQRGQKGADTIPTLEQVEQRHIADTLRRVGGNRARAAEALGIANSTLYEKIKRYGIDA